MTALATPAPCPESMCFLRSAASRAWSGVTFPLLPASCALQELIPLKMPSSFPPPLRACAITLPGVLSPVLSKQIPLCPLGFWPVLLPLEVWLSLSLIFHCLFQHNFPLSTLPLTIPNFGTQCLPRVLPQNSGGRRKDDRGWT